MIVDAHAARRKANRWLLENVGNMMRADQPVFVRSRGRAAWRFGAFVTAILHPPVGPAGYVDVDAATGEVLADDHAAEEIASRGERLVCHHETSQPVKENAMSALSVIQVTEKGLFLPRQLLQDLGEIEVVQRDDYILIKPKNMTARFKSFVLPHTSVEELHEDYELSLLEGATL